MKMITHSVRQLTVAVALGLVSATSAFALGFRNPDQGARATGQGEAFTAQADDASAVYYNPAGLTQLAGTEVASGGYISLSSTDYKGAGGNASLDSTAFVPHFYLATDFGKAASPWRFGLGFNVPFGNAVNWGQATPFAMILTKTDLAVFNIAPSVAYRFNEHLSIGVDLNIYHGDTMLENMQVLPSPPFPPATLGKFHFNGDGNALGATVGLLWKINDRHSFGAVYRSPFSINFKDQARLGTPAGPIGPVGANATIAFPQTVTGGYAFRPTPRWKLEFDIEWTNWDPLNNVVLNAPGAPFNGFVQPFQWLDSFFYEFGAQYQFNDRWTGRLGYIFSDNSVPSSTYSPSLPDSDRHVFSVGLGYTAARWQVDVVYQYTRATDRTVTGSPFGLTDGKWASDGHLLSCTTTLKF